VNHEKFKGTSGIFCKFIAALNPAVVESRIG